MKRLIWLFFIPMLAYAAPTQVNITAPTMWTNGDPLPLSDIDKYVLCIAVTSADVCDSELDMSPSTLNVQLSGLPGNTHHLKIKTITVSGVEGDYGPIFMINPNKPNPPTLSY